MQVIKTWEELDGLESEHYKIEVDSNRCSGWIKPKIETEETEREFFEHHEYLSTHTFYGGTYQFYTKLLQDFGFDVVLESWDKED